MTVRELRDALNNYIVRDHPDTWILNDCEADEKLYDERCKSRENDEVIILDDGMQPKYFGIQSAFGTTLYRQKEDTFKGQNVVAVCTDLTNELK